MRKVVCLKEKLLLRTKHCQNILDLNHQTRIQPGNMPGKQWRNSATACFVVLALAIHMSFNIWANMLKDTFDLAQTQGNGFPGESK